MYVDIDRKIGRAVLPFFAAATGVCLFTFMLGAVIMPQSARIARYGDSIRRAKAVIDNRDRGGIIKSEMLEKKKLLEQKMGSLTSGFADPEDLSGLLQLIFDKAWKEGIKFDRTEPQPETAGDEYVEYPVLFEMKTSYISFGRFISSMERMPQIVRIDRMALTADKNGSVEAKILITCFLNPKSREG